MPGQVGVQSASDLEDEEGESVASEGSLSESGEMLGTTWAGEAGGDATGAAGVAGAGGGGAGLPHATEWQNMELRSQKESEREGWRSPCS